MKSYQVHINIRNDNILQEFPLYYAKECFFLKQLHFNGGIELAMNTNKNSNSYITSKFRQKRGLMKILYKYTGKL